jgi:hypothetical protein
MTPIALALALFLADAPAAGPAAATQEAPWPSGAPREVYPFVAWCYGNLRGWLELHDTVMPEVTRIESSFRKPGSKLEDDLKIYADMRKEGRSQLKLFQDALTAAEKASLKPINTVGAEAVRKGRGVWTVAPDTPKARVAQEWMSWALPARCETTAKALAQRARLMGPAFKVNVEPEAEQAPAATPEASPAS